VLDSFPWYADAAYIGAAATVPCKRSNTAVIKTTAHLELCRLGW
jgi:hypothetical protein